MSDEARERLQAMTETTDGFEIAERDLQLRGPGDFFGTRQAGIPTFRLIDLVRDHALLDIAHARGRRSGSRRDRAFVRRGRRNRGKLDSIGSS